MARVNMGDTWERTTEFVGELLGSIVPVALAALVVPSLVGTWVNATLGTGDGPGRIVAGVAVLGLALLSFWGQFAIAAMAIPALSTRRPTQVATERVLPGIGIFLLLAIVAIVLFLVPLAVIAVVYGIDFAQLADQQALQALSAGGNAGGVLAIGVATIVLSVGLIAFAVRLAPLTAVIAAERRGVGSIARAWGLTGGLWWKLIGVAILYGIVAWVAGAAAQFVFGFGLALLLDRLSITWIVASAVPVAIVSAIFTVLATVFCAKLYVALADQPASATIDPLA